MADPYRSSKDAYFRIVDALAGQGLRLSEQDLRRLQHVLSRAFSEKAEGLKDPDGQRDRAIASLSGALIAGAASVTVGGDVKPSEGEVLELPAGYVDYVMRSLCPLWPIC
ncbi:hypothetical protein [Nocardioides sp. KR10-350]|uniref:hypothetical protein n=1 Tax=Nocardioides cheoyonin TaxID=3156615 RepID=UPI0032B58E07